MKILYVKESLHTALRMKAIHSQKTLQEVTDEILSVNLYSLSTQGK